MQRCIMQQVAGIPVIGHGLFLHKKSSMQLHSF